MAVAAKEKMARRVAKARANDRPGRGRTGATTAKGRSKKDRAKKKRVPWTLRPMIPVTLGAAWGIVLLAAVNLGAIVAAIVVIPIGVVAGASTVKVVLADAPAPGVKQVAALGMAMPAVLTLAALGGPAAAVVVAVIGGALAALGIFRVLGPRWALIPATVAVIAPAVACMTIVLARGQGANEADAFIGAMCAYDLACFLMGNARTALGGPVGIFFGWVSVAVVAVLAAAIMDPPFSGSRTWILFGIIAVLAPVGVAAANWLARGTRLPALRRLDSLLLAGPAWVIGVAVLLHH